MKVPSSGQPTSTSLPDHPVILTRPSPSTPMLLRCLEGNPRNYRLPQNCNQHTGGGEETLAGYLIMLLVLIPYFAFRVLGEALGDAIGQAPATQQMVHR